MVLRMKEERMVVAGALGAVAGLVTKIAADTVLSSAPSIFVIGAAIFAGIVISAVIFAVFRKN